MYVTAKNLCFLRRDKKFDEVGIVLEKSVERNECWRVNYLLVNSPSNNLIKLTEVYQPNTP